MSIRLELGWYIDDNNNRWSCRYTSKLAESYSRTLRNCSDCVDCINCTDCADCTNCHDCADCIDCTNCSDCDYCDYCIDCNRCNHCTNCINCNHCGGCDRCDDCGYCDCCVRCTTNPQRIYGWTMGSRDDIPKVYWIKAGEEQCVVGCFRGTLDELEARVKETHKDNPKHLHDYLRFIKAVRTYQEACKDENVL